MYDRFRAAKSLAQPVCLQIGSRFLVSELAFVGWLTNTFAAVITAQSFEQSCHSTTAVRAMHPRSAASEMTARPRNLDSLRGDLVSRLDVDPITIKSDPLDTGSYELRPARKPTTVETAAALQSAHVDTIDRQFLDCCTFEVTVLTLQKDSLVESRHSVIVPFSVSQTIALLVELGPVLRRGDDPNSPQT
jgi:hypothetical protein